MSYKLTNKANTIHLAALLIIIVIMLYFGLKPKNLDLNNHFTLLPEHGYAEFTPPSIAFYPAVFNTNQNSEKKLNLHLVIAPDKQSKTSFKFILHIQASTPEKDLVIAQWDETLVIMNGDDYSNKKREPKIYAHFPQMGEPVFVSIISSDNGTRVYFNGAARYYNKNLFLALPDSPAFPLFIGNSSSGLRAWEGKLYGLSIYYSREDRSRAVLQNFTAWKQTGHILSMQNKNVIAALDFSAPLPEHLVIPEIIRPQKPHILNWPSYFKWNYTTLLNTDVILNFTGFIPFGFLLMFFFPAHIRIPYRVFLVSVFSFSFSFFLEIAQVWIPFRDSSLLDLTLNTLGGFAGGLSYLLMSYLTQYLRSQKVQ